MDSILSRRSASENSEPETAVGLRICALLSSPLLLTGAHLSATLGTPRLSRQAEI